MVSMAVKYFSAGGPKCGIKHDALFQCQARAGVALHFGEVTTTFHFFLTTGGNWIAGKLFMYALTFSLGVALTRHKEMNPDIKLTQRVLRCSRF